MTHTIGVGLLFDDETFNSIRKLELKLSETTNNLNGLRQPPHVTVKRPCEVMGSDSLKKAQKIIEELSKTTSEFSVRFKGVSNFGDATLYLDVEKNPQLTSLHTDLLDKFSRSFKTPVGQFEGPNMVFHSTLAMGLTESEFNTASKTMSTLHLKSTQFKGSVVSLGLFLGMDKDTNWVIIATARLRYT